MAADRASREGSARNRLRRRIRPQESNTMTQTRPASLADHSKEPPQISKDGEKTWITRGANLVVAVSEVAPGTTLSRPHNDDEYWVILGGSPAHIEAGGEAIDAAAETLTVVPPGASAVTMPQGGTVVRVFSNRAEDLAALAVNAATYADGAPECAPLVPWPAPADGFKLRNYRPEDHDRPDTNMRVFRSTNIMVNAMRKRTEPRDITALSPHSHADYEQASLLMEGTYVHHMRWPWGKDMNDWKPDIAMEAGSPSVLMIPAQVIHTSRSVGPETAWLIDLFAPPRRDFSARPGFVCNAEDYPLPDDMAAQDK